MLLITSLVLLSNCANKPETEIYQSKRDNVLKVKERVHEIKIDDPLIGSFSMVFLLNDHLLILDVKSNDKLINIFNKEDYKYLMSTAPIGGGPGEISNIGFIGTNNTKNEFYVSDHGKQKIFCYNMDSLLRDSLYLPTVKVEMNKALFPSTYEYINDTLSIGLIIKPKIVSGYTQSVARWNMKTGKIIPMKYEHPKIEKKRVSMAVSKEHNLYVEAYHYSDLLTICDLYGNLVANIYGPDWSEKQTSKITYYGDPVFYKDKIIVSYSGTDSFTKEEGMGPRVVLPTKLLVLDIKGNYIKTLDVGYSIQNFCCDEESNRLIMSFDDDMQFGYLDLKGLI